MQQEDNIEGRNDVGGHYRIEGWMDEWCFRPLLCTVKAELGRGQPGLMR